MRRALTLVLILFAVTAALAFAEPYSDETIRFEMSVYFIDCLGRLAQPADEQAWINAVRRKQPVNLRHFLSDGICYAPEAMPHAVASAYRQCLKRAASPAEIAYWVNKRGSVRSTVREICLSPESMSHVLESWESDTRVNHLTRDSSGYNVWQNNCHTAANNAVQSSPQNTGILVCGGDPTSSPEHHTAAYQRNDDGSTTYYNYAKPCGPCPGAPPASYGSGNPDRCHLECAKKICDDQFSGETRVLPVGQTIEIPGPSVCYRETAKTTPPATWWRRRSNAAPLAACNQCCDQRANRWNAFDSNYLGGDLGAEDFRRACFYLCRANFR